MSDGAQLAGEAELAEAGQRLAGVAGQRHAFGGAGDGERDRQVRAGLVDPHAADDVDEHVGVAQADAAVTAEHGQHERDAVAVQA